MRHVCRSTAQPTFSVCLIVVSFMVLVFSNPALAAEDAVGADTATTLLAISFVLCVCILAVSGFTLWQSHRHYLDTVRLSREITATTTELHQKVVDLIFNLKDFLAHESRMAQSGTRHTTEAQSREATDRVDKIVTSISDTESKIRVLEETLDKLNEQLSFNFQPADLSQKIATLNDIEFAVLFKLSQDPKFFEKHSFSSFGATPKVIDSLLSRQLIVFDLDGKAEVPQDVALALRHSGPEN